MIGALCDREVALENEFGIAAADLRAHTLVTGLTGMGKSTTIREMLSQAAVPFLVLEPAKSEYRNCGLTESLSAFTRREMNRSFRCESIRLNFHPAIPFIPTSTLLARS